ncbi:MAG: hypothetical protein ACI9OE_002919 [Mariniflexile sp.]|jgi:hypothetical protein
MLSLPVCNASHALLIVATAAKASQFSKFITISKDKLVSLFLLNCKGIVAVFPFNNTSIEQVLFFVLKN